MDNLPAWLAAIITAVFPQLGEPPEPVYAGYAEAAFVYVAPTLTRQITGMHVAEGDTVVQDQLLFAMDATREAASLKAALAREAAAEANLHNLETGSREAEVNVVRASLEQALAEQSLARTNLARSQSLYESEIVTTARVDADRTALESANARVAQLRAQLEVAELPARDEQREAAQATLEAASAEVELARSTLADLTVSAPVEGLVEKVFYDQGEVAAAGAPVVALLPPWGLKVFFYIPEPERMSFSVGQSLALTCDGCPEGAQVTITRMGSDPQYTPPIIYSREERARLVFRAEARLDGDFALLPGQPVTLKLLP